MRRLTGAAFVSLDGVMQAPGGPTEDWTQGFGLGGWLAAVEDEAIGETVAALFAPPYALLLGRRTFDIFAAHWPHVSGEEAAFGAALTAADKYVVTRSDRPLGWGNSHRLPGVDAVAALKASAGPDLLIQGSSTLYPPLLAAGLIDRLVLMIAPVVLGAGKRLFGTGTPPGALRLLNQRTGSGGVIVAHYAPAGTVVTRAIAPPSGSAAEADRQRAISAGSW